MKNFIIYILIGGFFLTMFPQNSHAYWIWSRKKQKWSNPETAPLATPVSQFEHSLSYYDKGDYKTAYKEFNKVLIHFADSVEAPDAQYYIGLCLQKMGKHVAAFREFQKVVESYPYSERINEIVKLQYEIGVVLIERQDIKILGVKIDPDDWVEHPSIDIFKKVIDNAPYSEEAVAAQYKLGLLYKELVRYEDAINSFKELIDKYPDSRWFEPAKYQLALCSSEASLASDYDQELSKEAKEQFSEFIKNHPEAELSDRAQEELAELKNKEVEKHFITAEFYAKQNQNKSAKIYYKYVIDNFPRTKYAIESEKKLRELDNK